LLIAYDGTEFQGWQRQPSAPTVQACLESALARVLGESAAVHGSGRTDAGVHALNQVANFQTACSIPCPNLVKALNDALPPSVRVKEAGEAGAGFHARHAARSKTYRYRILQAPVCSPFQWRFVWHYPFPLDARRMAEATKLFEGEHDFTSFAAAAGNDELAEAGKDWALRPHAAPGRVRTIFSSRLLRRSRPPLLIYQVSGSGFLHHMVRNIVGTLVEVGRGKWERRDVARILAGRDRTLAGPTAPAQGLCLMKVEY
jgi:tRNA pseudouridine38-40 synthase